MDAIMSHNNNMVVVKILNYSENAFTDVHYNLEETAEDVCERLSRNNRMKPISLGLFGLKNHNDDVYLWPGAKLQQNVKYEFRMRYKVIYQYHNILIMCYRYSFIKHTMYELIVNYLSPI